MPLLEIKNEYNKLMCVYKVTFDEKYFYIGSSGNLKKRIGIYNSLLKGCGLKRQSKRIVHAANKCKSVKIEVLEIVVDKSKLRDIEDVYIKANFDNELILNRSNNAFNSKGVVWTKEERLAISKGLTGIKRSNETKQLMSLVRKGKPQKRVARRIGSHCRSVLNVETGIFYDSISEAARTTFNLSPMNLSHILRGITKTNKTPFILV